MIKYRNILVAIDPNQEAQPALSRALYLAQQEEGAEITAFLSIYDFSYEMTSMLSADERQAMRDGVVGQRINWVRDLLKDYTDTNVPTHIKVVWHNRPFEAIIREVIQGGHDLLIKATHQHDGLESLIFTPTDWHLLRKCPCPVLMVKNNEWREYSKLLVAVNLSSDEEYHQSLNEKLICEAQSLSVALQPGEVHLVNSYPSTPVNISIDIPEFDPKAYNDAIRGHHLLGMKTLRQQYHISAECTHVVEGLPEEVIPDVADKIDAELVILGTIGRTGISAAFIGNTAEHVIDRLTCDLLAVKPDGFVCPITDSLAK
ncbi:universal stress protein UspE [Plesiomonas shigelloides]|uniref:universal stress protein UspE n=1 Tax=Plesiomonas shigelloides TaxID=703 RepID=UPI001C5B2349|nr:universal stress protein UspE [Plesiomonas shigelloides]MBW3792836.1 universal stress protein UspE [Plesiomonas shigelloides]